MAVNPAESETGVRYTVVTPEPVRQYADAITQSLTTKETAQQADIREELTAQAFEELCSGTHRDTIFVTALEIDPVQEAECAKNGVRTLIAAQLGYNPVVFVQKSDSPAISLTTKAVYLALAARTPFEEGFADNKVMTWNDVDPTMPDSRIKVILPPRPQGIRELFDIEVMEGGCRNFTNIRYIFSASERTALCVTLRNAVIDENPDDEVRAEMLRTAPSGTVALVTIKTYQKNRDWLRKMPIDGFQMTRETLMNEDYTLALPLYIYANADDFQGGKANSGMQAWLSEALSEDAIGDQGYLSSGIRGETVNPLYLEFMPASVREWQRRSLKQYLPN